MIVRSLINEVWEILPFAEQEIARAVQEDKTLKEVYDKLKSGWQVRKVNQSLQLHEQRKMELSIHRGCLRWNNRVVVPPQF